MADYIDRKELMVNLARFAPGGYSEKVALIIEKQPAVDVASIRHGRWIELDECVNEGVFCSVCHKKVYRANYAQSSNPVKMKSPYCPNCGVRMDLEEGNV